MNLGNCVFVVDGQSDRDSIKGYCEKHLNCKPYFRVANCNGKRVTPEGYANAVAPTISICLTGSIKHIVCIVDREDRPRSAKDLETDLQEALVKRLLQSVNLNEAMLRKILKVCVPDRMLENWIVADVESLKCRRNLVKQTAQQKQFDGQHGVTVLQSMLLQRYLKTTHAPLLFKCIRVSMARTNSPCFAGFAREVLGAR